MARIRYIKPEFFDSEQVASVSLGARLLFAGLWTVADREGRFEFSPRRIKARLFPYDTLDVEPLLAELAVAKLILVYRVDAALFGWVPGFTKHQRPHPNEAKSTLPSVEQGTVADADSWNVTSARDAITSGNDIHGSCNVTSRNDACTQSRGEGNGEGTEGERTEHALVSAIGPRRTAAEIAHHPPVAPRLRSSYGDPHGFRIDPTAAALIDLGGERVVSVPAGWATKACREYGLTDADVQAFAQWCGAYTRRHGFEDGGKRLAWLDARLAEWRAERARPNDGLRPASEFLSAQAARAADVPDLTPEQRRALLRPARPAGGQS